MSELKKTIEVIIFYILATTHFGFSHKALLLDMWLNNAYNAFPSYLGQTL